MTEPVRVRPLLSGGLALVALAVGTVARPSVAQEGYFDRPIPPAYCQVDDARREVLLLGSYHMSNPEADQFNLEADDVLAPERQAEIRAVVDALERFAATHVAVEAPWGDSVTLARYRAYAAGERELRRSEEEQIGFRLARARGLETVHPIDVPMGLEFEAVGQVASQDPRLARKLGTMQGVGEEAIRLMGERLAQGSIGAMLYWMNESENLQKAHIPYIEFFAPIVAGEDYAGADMLARWYQRNLRIFANLTRVATEPDARVFLVFGQGHIPILRELLIQHPDFCVENPLPYLEGL